MDISESIDRAISSYFSQWLGQHPYLSWSLSHPLPSLVIILIWILLLWGLIKAIGRAIEQLGLFILKTPLRLLQPIFGSIWRSIVRIFGHNNSSGSQPTAKSTPTPTAIQIERIVDRLQVLSQEQEMLLDELSLLTSSTSVRADLRKISDTKYGSM